MVWARYWSPALPGHGSKCTQKTAHIAVESAPLAGTWGVYSKNDFELDKSLYKVYSRLVQFGKKARGGYIQFLGTRQSKEWPANITQLQYAHLVGKLLETRPTTNTRPMESKRLAPKTYLQYKVRIECCREQERPVLLPYYAYWLVHLFVEDTSIVK